MKKSKVKPYMQDDGESEKEARYIAEDEASRKEVEGFGVFTEVLFPGKQV